jgi:two-component system, NtrC family, nitrogen regulation response regulator GlnG
MDVTTVGRGGEPGASSVAPEHVLTIVYHPDLSRVGERVVLSGKRVRVSRSEPEFCSPRGGKRRPLATPHVSRRPVELRLGGSAHIASHPDASPLALEGHTVRCEVRLESGAVLTLGGVLLHYDRVAVSDLEVLPPMGMLGESAAIQRMRRRILKVASHDIPILVRGETGAGKELVAHALHAHGGRSAGPLVSVNLAAIPESMAGAALFGHEKGAFTGADRSSRGYFREADGGTIFLDEVGEAPSSLQPALLRTLENGEIQPVGASRGAAVNVRMIAATDALLERAVEEGRFRLPLMMRLAGYEIMVPALRERRDDIARMLVAFLAKELEVLGALDRLAPPEPGVPAWLGLDTMRAIVAGEWRGNVRELKNVARQLAVDDAHEACATLRYSPLMPTLDPPANESAPSTDATRSLRSVSDEELVDALEVAGYRPAAAAKALGVSRTSIYQLMRERKIRQARDLEASEIASAIDQHGGDLAAAAQSLRVTERALQLRLRTLDASD